MRFLTSILIWVSFASWPVSAFAQSTSARAGGAKQNGETAPTSSAAAAAVEPNPPSKPEPSLADQLDAAAGKAVPATGGPPPAVELQGGFRGFQSLNPDLSVILTGAAGFSQRAPLVLAGDDPDLKGGPSDHSAGITLQELEVGFQSIVDPYFRADAFLTVPNMAGLEVEEAFLTTTSLPYIQVKAGVFRSAFGRQNGMHLHVQDFVRRPLINSYLGTDGLRPPGAQVSWLLPLPIFVQLVGEVLSVAAPDSSTNPQLLQQLSTFGGGRRTDLTYAGELKFFVPTSESLSVLGGLNAATGLTPGLVQGQVTSYQGARSMLYGVDLYVKYKPPNQALTYFSLAWTTEYFLRTIAGTPGAENGSNRLTDGGFYTQVVVQFARRWFVGVRQDLLGWPSSEVQPCISRTALNLTFYPSEFSKLRASVEYEAPDANASRIQQLSLSHVNSVAAFLQFEVAIGAHGAHKF